MAKKEEYNASAIQALTSHEHLLKRISLTFGRETGDKDEPFSSQKSVAIREITDNAIDEVLGGYASNVNVHYYDDGAIEVQDNGRGLPVDTGHDAAGNPVSGIYLTLGVIQSGGKFTTDSNRFSMGLNGVGASSTIHLSERAQVTVYRDNKVYELQFQNGTPGFFDNIEDPTSDFKPLDDLTYLKQSSDDRPADVKKTYKTGTRVKLWLNDSVFSSKYPVNTLDITERLRGTAFLVPELTVHIQDDVNKIEDPETGKMISRDDTYHIEGGLPELVKANAAGSIIGDVFSFDTTTSYVEKNVPVLQKNGKVTNKDVDRELPIHVAFAWQNNFDYNIESYVNTIRTRLGGVHEDAFEKALTDAFGDRFNSIQGLTKASDPDLKFEDFSEGLVAVVYAQISEPQFTGQSKEELGGREVKRAMTNALKEVFGKFAQSSKNTDLLRQVGEKVVTAARTRQQAHQQQELKRQKSAIESSGDLPTKLVDCEITHDENSELYIVEGDSALSALKAARDSRYQALMPIRGKIIGAEKSTMNKVLQNKEVQDIIKCLGAGSGSTFDINKMRYSRVLIAADADPDGGDIAALITSIFWNLFKPVVLEGRLYRVNTPLHVLTYKEKGKKQRLYANNDEENDAMKQSLEEQHIKFTDQRIKGLGEGGADVLWETGMDPANRTVTQLIVDDTDDAQRMLDVTLGSDVTIRKDWIQDNPIDEFENLE